MQLMTAVPQALGQLGELVQTPNSGRVRCLDPNGGPF
jgi:hypothetical protein